MAYLSNKPLYILKENTEQFRGNSALKRNIQAIIAVSEAIKTTLGPKGLNKMIVDSLGDVVVTNDGSKILEELSIENPTAKMIVDLSKTIKKNVGDGTSSIVIFIGELMKQVDNLLSLNLHPALIYDGFSIAIKELNHYLNDISIKADINNEKIRKNIVKTALKSKNLLNAEKLFIDIVCKIVQHIKSEDSTTIDLDQLQIIKKQGEGLEDSLLINGLIVDKEVVNPMMPKIINNAKIALIDGALEIVKTDFSSEIQITTPNEIQEFLNQEEEILHNLVEAIYASGANVVFCQKGIDEPAQHYLAKYGIMAIRRVKHSDMKKLSQATGAKIVTRIKSISEKDLGTAAVVAQKKIGKDDMIFIEGCENPKAVTVLIRGANEELLDDAERAIKNGVNNLKALFELPLFVGGAGSIEIELRKHLRDFAHKNGGKIQIAINHFADALEIIPNLLALNAGKNPLDINTEMRAKVNYKDNKIMGFDVYSSKVVDCLEKGIIEPTKIKSHVYTLATELALILIRVDDYIKKG